MTVFISGGAKNGKSTLAQRLAISLAKGGKRYYVATMIPTDEEDRERIRLHVADREGLGFETLECGGSIASCLEKADRDGVFLVDSATALLQNALFPREKNYEMDLPGADRCARELLAFLGQVGDAVVVSDYIYSDCLTFDPGTRQYCRCLAALDRELARACDTVVEVCAGQYIVHKGALPE